MCGVGLGESGERGLCVQLGRAVTFMCFGFLFGSMGNVGGGERGRGELVGGWGAVVGEVGSGVGGREGRSSKKKVCVCVCVFSSIPVTETDSPT